MILLLSRPPTLSTAHSKMNREKVIIRTSLIGIIGNVLLVAAKALIGVLAHSISIITDAINNLSDALSSTITIVGTKISTRKPDKKHPFGHGRVEYLTSLIIGIIVLVAGGTAIYESIMTLINGDIAEYNIVSIIVISLAIVVKVALGLYFRHVGKKTNSEPLKASGKDALFDALLSVATTIGIITSLVWKVNVEGYIGILIGLFIIKSGIEILRDGISLIIGERADQDIVNKIKKIVCSFEEVKGAYDLIINNYGVSKAIASVHIEVDDNLTAREIHHLTRIISEKIYNEMGIILTVGIYATNEANDEIKNIKQFIQEQIKENKDVKQLHGFYVDDERKLITFDLVFEFTCKNTQEVIASIQTQLKEKYPEYDYYVVQDTDFTD